MATKRTKEAVVEPIIDIFQSKTFNKSYSPSTFVSFKTIDIYRVNMSCGGGMGGANWDEFFTEDIPEHEGEMTLKRTNIYGKEMKINTRWVVRTEKVRLGIFIEDITAWAKYRGEEVPKGKKMIHKVVFWYRPNEFEFKYDTTANTDVDNLGGVNYVHSKKMIV